MLVSLNAKSLCGAVLPLLCVVALSARAQGGATAVAPSPLLGALRLGAPRLGGPLLRGAAVAPAAAEALEVAPLRLALLEGPALTRRRIQFAEVGGVVGAVAATVWYVRSTHGDNGAQFYLAGVLLPIPIFAGAVTGAVAGYGVSFIVYPSRRAG
jgi:hypothetical protein